MKICIDGLSLDQYQKSSYMEEFGIYLENMDVIDPHECDDLIVPFMDETQNDVAMEDSLAVDMIKGGWRASRGLYRAGTKSIDTVNREWTKLKNRWSDIRPRIMKLVREFGQSLQNMWHKYLQYDKKYKELGMKIQQVIQYSIRSLTDLPSITLRYHQFNVETLKDILTYMGNYDLFWDEVMRACGGTALLGEKNNKFQYATKVIQAPNIPELKRLNTQLSELVANLSNGGDATIIRNIMTNRGNGGSILGINRTADRLLDKETRKESNQNNLNATEYLKLAILSQEQIKSYNSSNVEQFKQDMTGPDGFLNLVASMVNNDVLSGALKSSGKTVKTETDKMMKWFDEIMSTARKHDENNAAKEQANQNNPGINAATQQKSSVLNKNSDGTGMPDKPEFNSMNEKSDISDEAGQESITSLTEMFVRNMTVIFTKTAAAYQSVVKGVLAATYQIISEADQIISIIEGNTGPNTPKGSGV